MAVSFPTVGPGLTPRSMKSAAKQFIKDELSMTEQRNADRMEMRKSSKAYKKLQGIKTDILGETIEDIFEDDDDEAAVDEERSNVADLVDDDVEDDDPVRELYSSDEDHPSDEDDEISDDVEDGKKVVVAPKQIAKVFHKNSNRYSLCF